MSGQEAVVAAEPVFSVVSGHASDEELAALTVVVTASLFTGLTPRIRVPWDVASCLLAGVVVAKLLQRYRAVWWVRHRA